jgi:hypothetical protein
MTIEIVHIPLNLKFMRQFFLFLFLLSFNFSSQASHLMGGEITWRTDSLNRFIFQVKLYLDCNGIGGPGSITLSSNIPAGQVACLLVSSSDISPVGPGCPTCANPQLNSSAVQEFIFESAPITLTGAVPVNGWYFEYTDCCRNAAIVNLDGAFSGSFTLRAIMYSDGPGGTVTGTDNSPKFLISPTIAVCPGEFVEYSHVAYDPELDSLKYEWATPLGSGFPNPTNYPFAFPYSYNSPLPGTTQNPGNIPADLDSTDGTLRFKSFNAGGYVTVVKVTSWKCGIKTAEIYREIQINVVSSCQINSTPPVANLSPQLSINEFGTLTPIYHDTVLAGDMIRYSILSVEPQMDSTGTSFQSLELTSHSPHFGLNYTDSLNGCLIAPCATLSSPGTQLGTFSLGNTLTFPTACAHASYINGCLQHQRVNAFTFKAKDDFCPANGVKFKTLNVVVSGPQLMSNGNDLTVSLPGSAIQWYLNGVPIPGANDTIYTPTQNGIYSVIATVPGGCQLISNALPRTSTNLQAPTTELIQNVYVDANKNLQVVIQSAASSPALFEIISMDGKLVRSFNTELQSGVQHLSLSLEGINEGIYFLQTVTNGNRSSKKFYVQP